MSHDNMGIFERFVKKEGNDMDIIKIQDGKVIKVMKSPEEKDITITKNPAYGILCCIKGLILRAAKYKR